MSKMRRDVGNEQNNALLKSPNSLIQRNRPLPAHSIQISVIIVGLGLVATIAISVVCCALATSVIIRGSDWTALHNFGGYMSLQSARYLNFTLDMVVRILTVFVNIMLNYTAIHVATKLSLEGRGILTRDALQLNIMRVEAVSL
ncbi:hypothetical protein BDV93DRAFT_237663 [Ceratobasidium sp. AG-I]|nr:hypothetical protein BDV93DRAFT_237663 [Ceratobasidium sp. AG-I]